MAYHLTQNRGVRVQEYAYYVNKLRQNVGLETWIWRQIVTSQTAHTKYKWPHKPLNETSPWKFSACATGRRYVSVLSNATARYLGSERKGRASLLKLTYSSHLASLLLRLEDCRHRFCSAELSADHIICFFMSFFADYIICFLYRWTQLVHVYQQMTCFVHSQDP